MALDDHLLHSARPGDEPILHLWRWDRPTISLGYAQAPSLLNMKRIEVAGLRVIRRPTGGKAVLHGADISYACVVPRPYRDWDDGLKPPYIFVARTMSRALRAAGVPCGPPTESIRVERGGDGASCGSEVHPHELVASREKVLGSAQKRVRGGILMQGTISPAGPAELGAFLASGEAALVSSDAPAHSLTLHQVIEAFEEEHAIRFEPLVLSDRDTRSIADIAARRYGSAGSTADP